MKTPFAAAAIALTACAPAVASETKEGICEVHHKLSYQIMVLRQQGNPMPGVIKTINNDKFTPLVIRAYDHPRMRVKANQFEMAHDFANDEYRNCLKSRQ